MTNNHPTTRRAKALAGCLIAAFGIVSAPALADRQGPSGAARQTVSAKPQRVWVAAGDVNGDGRSDTARSGKPQRSRMQQNGTTVATAGDVQAPAQRRPHLLLPAVQKAQAEPRKAKLKQNGTTVATAGEVQAPQAPGQAALLLPAVQKAQAEPRKAKLKQNGTTVATDSEVAAPTRD
jgi:hypothetical protein